MVWISLIFVEAYRAARAGSPLIHAAPLRKAAPLADPEKFTPRPAAPSRTMSLNPRQPTLAVASRAPAPPVVSDFSAPQRVQKRKEESDQCERCRPVPAHGAEHGQVPTHRASLQGPGNGSGYGPLPRIWLARQAEKTAAVIAGARQPEPVVNPGNPHWRRCITAGRSPIPLITFRRSTRLRSSSR